MSWRRNSSFSCSLLGIRNACRRRILNEVIQPLKQLKVWKVLVVDELGMKVISTCCKTEEILKENIAIIETLEEKREPLPQFSAIYIVAPTEMSMKLIDADFQGSSPLYFNVHLFFLSAIPEGLFQHLCLAKYAERIKTIKQINILYLPCESQVYSLDMPDFFPLFFNTYEEFNIFYCDSVADKIMTLFCTISEIPTVRYRRGFIKNLILAEAIQKRINECKESSEDGKKEGHPSNRCQLLIIDRGFDCISPLLHEFTFQAMAFDLFKINNNIYSYSVAKKEEDKEGEDGGKKVEEGREKVEELQEISLSEEDPIWRSFRHEHIANVARTIQSMSNEDPVPPDKDGFKRLTSLGKDVKKHFNLQKKIAHFAFKHLTNECMKLFCSGLNKLADIEQNLALEIDSDGKEVINALPEVLCLLKNEAYTKEEKIRVLFLYLFYEKGIPYKRFRDLLHGSEIDLDDVSAFHNLAHLGVDVFRRNTDYFPSECKVIDPPSYKMSRWTPMIKSIMQKSIAGTLSEEEYPFLEKQHDFMKMSRTGYWCADKKSDKSCKLVIFLAGGVTYSEMRVAYEVMAQYGGWEIIVGSDCLLTPKLFLKKLENLPYYSPKEM